MRRFLGFGKSRDFKAGPGEILEEEGKRVYAVPSFGYYCKVCDGCGCKCCGWNVLEEDRKNKIK